MSGFNGHCGCFRTISSGCPKTGFENWYHKHFAGEDLPVLDVKQSMLRNGFLLGPYHERLKLPKRSHFSHRTERTERIAPTAPHRPHYPHHPHGGVWNVLGDSICHLIAHTSVGTYDVKDLKYGRRSHTHIYAPVRNTVHGA